MQQVLRNAEARCYVRKGALSTLPKRANCFALELLCVFSFALE
jgi:hypothetical protein